VALTTGTLDYTRERAAPLHRSRFALAGLTEEIAEMEFREGVEGFLMDNRVAPSIIAAADRDQLFRVLHNLAQNAAQSGAHHLCFRAAESEALLLIEIADDGPGLPPKARENLFRPFAGSARPGGTGLGLAIAREVMRAHGGDIALDETTGAGTIFRLSLPRASARG
jgi:signal transduction histidine kinase